MKEDRAAFAGADRPAKEAGHASFLHTTATLLRRRLAALKSLLLNENIPADMADRLLLGQAAGFCEKVGVVFLPGICIDLLLFLDFLHSPGSPRARMLGVLSVVTCTAAVLAVSLFWQRRRTPTPRGARLYLGVSAALIGLLEIFWSILLFTLSPEASPAQLNLICGIIVGCIATSAMLAPLICAIAYWLPGSLGALIIIFLAPWADQFALIGLVTFVLLIGLCVVYFNRWQNERNIDAIRLEDNAEVIKLLLRDFEESASDWLWETNARMELLPVSRRLAQVAMRAPESFTGIFPGALLGTLPAPDAPEDQGLARLRAAITARLPFRDIVVPALAGDERRHWSLTGKPTFDRNGVFTGYHGVGSDVTGTRRQQEQIVFLAGHDSLTNLANRTLFSQALRRACEESFSQGAALLWLDLDNFKNINDTLGHAVGDALLAEVAERIRGCVREADIVARLGGDEFAALVAAGSGAEALTAAERIIERLSAAFPIDGKFVRIGASIGIALAPEDGHTPERLMRSADLALYRAKAEGRNAARLYDPAMDRELLEKRTLQADLRHALERGEFRLEYQPVISLNDGRITGAEALLRWHHPERGRMLPNSFIPLAEEIGLIVQLTDWVLREACAAAASWPGNIPVSVNISPAQFLDRNLVPTVRAALMAAGLSPSRLELEILETAMLALNGQTEETLRQLQESGVHIALDDFGTGYSSFSYLSRLPFNRLKIDRTFISGLGRDAGSNTIVLAIIGLAERMNMLVTAEGVETAAQADMLATHGCGEAQGNYFYAPLPEAEFARFLKEKPALLPG